MPPQPADKKSYAAITAAVTAGVMAAWTAINSTPTSTAKDSYDVIAAALKQQSEQLARLETTVQTLRVRVAVLAALAANESSAAMPEPDSTQEIAAGLDSLLGAPAPASAPEAPAQAIAELPSFDDIQQGRATVKR